MTKTNFTIEECLTVLKMGRPIILADETDRENEGDLVLAASLATPFWINFMIREARGLICVPLEASRAQELGLSLMVQENQDTHKTAFTISADALCTGTGISAAERALSALWMADPSKKSQDFKKPGHLFPLIAREKGLEERRGHTEAAVELMKLCGLPPVAVICEILNFDGSMARRGDLLELSSTWKLPYITMEELITHTKGRQS